VNVPARAFRAQSFACPWPKLFANLLPVGQVFKAAGAGWPTADNNFPTLVPRAPNWLK